MISLPDCGFRGGFFFFPRVQKGGDLEKRSFVVIKEEGEAYDYAGRPGFSFLRLSAREASFFPPHENRKGEGSFPEKDFLFGNKVGEGKKLVFGSNEWHCMEQEEEEDNKFLQRGEKLTVRKRHYFSNTIRFIHFRSALFPTSDYGYHFQEEFLKFCF